jgi:hypothetical protein
VSHNIGNQKSFWDIEKPRAYYDEIPTISHSQYGWTYTRTPRYSTTLVIGDALQKTLNYNIMKLNKNTTNSVSPENCDGDATGMAAALDGAADDDVVPVLLAVWVAALEALGVAVGVADELLDDEELVASSGDMTCMTG